MLPFDDTLLERVRANVARFERRAIVRPDLVPAAVAVTLIAGESGEASFVITRRASALPDHGGQWALPGGRIDAGESAEQAALRELREEVGLALEASSVVGRLDDFATRSGFVITPIVVWGRDAEELKPSPDEVAAVYVVPVRALDHPEVPRLSRIPESERPVLSVPIEMLGAAIHAPTAAVIYQLREVAIHGRATRVAHYEQPLFAWR